MPAIWNVNNGYGINNKKVSSKLTFEVGEKFAGRISSSSDDNEVTVKLTDGWEFSAKLQDAEKFMKNHDDSSEKISGLVDYKFFCEKSRINAISSYRI